MKTRILDKVVGASAALAMAVPVALYAAPALAWTGQQSSGYGYQPAPGDYAQAPQPCNCQRSGQNGYQEQHHRYSQNGYAEQHHRYSQNGYQEQHHRYSQYGYQEQHRRYQRRYSYEQHERYETHRYGSVTPQSRTRERYGYNEYSRYGWRAPAVPPVRQPYAVPPRVEYGPPQPQPFVGSTGPRVGYAPTPPANYRPYRPGSLVATVFLNERVGPNDAAPVRNVLPPGTPVHPVGPQVAGWIRVNTPMGPGWVFGRYLQPG